MNEGSRKMVNYVLIQPRLKTKQEARQRLQGSGEEGWKVSMLDVPARSRQN